jgi:RimJ/RimL family protein N-acetyltransferase
MSKTISQLYNVHVRSWNEQDIDGYTELVSDPETMKYISAGTTRDRATAAAEIKSFQNEIREQGWSRWAVSLGPDSEFIGYVGFAKKEYGINFGSRFLKKYWGSPYPFIAIHLAIEYGFQQVGFEQIYTLSNVLNQRALKTILAFLHLPQTSGTIMQTPYGPHLKLELTHERFLQIAPINLARIERISRRITDPDSHAPLEDKQVWSCPGRSLCTP